MRSHACNRSRTLPRSRRAPPRADLPSARRVAPRPRCQEDPGWRAFLREYHVGWWIQAGILIYLWRSFGYLSRVTAARAASRWSRESRPLATSLRPRPAGPVVCLAQGGPSSAVAGC